MVKIFYYKLRRKFYSIINFFLKFFNLKLEGIKLSETEILKKIFKNKKLVAIDIGAHEGQTIEKFISISKNIKIYSFEPQQDLFEKLKNKYKSNNFIKIFPLAIDNKHGSREFYINNRTQISSFYKTKKNLSYKNFPEINLKNKKSLKVKTTTLDKFVYKNKIKKIDILKIDTECNDDKVLDGAKKILTKRIPKIIMIEVISGLDFERKISFFDIEKFLIPNRYEIFSLDKGGNLFNKKLTFNLIYIKKELRKKIIFN